MPSILEFNKIAPENSRKELNMSSFCTNSHHNTIPDASIIDSSKVKEQKLAEALKEFLPEALEWRDIGGYPILYRKGFLGSFKSIAFLSGGTKLFIESRKWKNAILEVVQKYKDASGLTIDVVLSDTPEKNQNN
jgi:hypothetical protein